ncbi:MAG: hypothetical protein [Podoviridae sp. cty5g4]|nr:MAG: hypothetical protein [Podoviridae sp. cty5g4]
MGVRFSHTIDSAHLIKGLRPFERIPKNSEYLIECKGAVGRDQVLHAIEALTRMDTSVITDGFPYPQLFVCTNLIIVCSRTKIYELVGNTLVEKLTVSPGSTWNVIDFYDYVYMSNGRVAVVRDAGSFAYSITTALPVFSAGCSYNGQVIIGAPGVVTIPTTLNTNTTALILNTYKGKAMVITSTTLLPISASLLAVLFTPSLYFTEGAYLESESTPLDITTYNPKFGLGLVPGTSSLSLTMYAGNLKDVLIGASATTLTISPHLAILFQPLISPTTSLLLTAYSAYLGLVAETASLSFATNSPVLAQGFTTSPISLSLSSLSPILVNGFTVSPTLLTLTPYTAILDAGYKGYIMGGSTGSVTNVIEDLIFSDETSQAISATLDTAKQLGAGVNSDIKGYIMGGNTGSVTNVIEDLIFSNETSQAISATLDTAKQIGNAGVNSSTKGYCCGGSNSSSIQVDVIEDLIFSGETSQAIAATLNTAKGNGAGVQSGYV